MRINSNYVSFNNSVRSTSESQMVNGREDALVKTSKGPVDKSEATSSDLISRQELLQLASDYKQGLISRDQANNRFIGTVINNSLQGKLSEKDCKKLIDEIAEFFSQDPEFLENLGKNLSALG